MLRQQQQVQQRIQMVVDAGLFALGFYLAHAIREHWQFAVFRGAKTIYPFEYYLWVFLLVIPVAPIALALSGFYRRPWLPTRRQTAWCLFQACTGTVVGLILLLWFLRESHLIARSVLIFFGVTSFALMLLKEDLVLRWRRSSLGQAQIKQRLVLVGSPEETEPLLFELNREQGGGFQVVARLDLNEEPVERLVDLMHEHSPNGVLLAAQHTLFGQIEKAIALCEREGVEVWLLADFFKPQISKTGVALLQGRPVLVFRSAPASVCPLLAKQVLDFFGALVLLVLTAPIMLVAVIGTRLSSPGPIFFRQERSGLNGRPFTMLKFRSMVTDAEQRQHELETLNEMSGPVFKVTNDPRITPFGRLLRRYSIDELPQLINVLRGEMSLVGPRPLPVHEVKRFDDPAHRRRLSVKPGLTCLWQVSGRNQVTDFNEWVRLDLHYIDNWSLWLDCRILLRTVPTVLSGAGAK